MVKSFDLLATEARAFHGAIFINERNRASQQLSE